MLEERWQVAISNNVLGVMDPQKNVQNIYLDKIRSIAIRTNNSGPMGSDVIWFVSDDASIVSFPMGAQGEKEALEAFQKIEGFDNFEFINAMSSVEDNVFILLDRTKV